MSRRSWIGPFGCHLQPAQAACLIAVLEEHQAQGRLRIHMARTRRALEPDLRRAEVHRYSAPEPVGLAKVERGVGIALLGKRPPNCDCTRIIGFLPGLDSRLYRLRVKRRSGGCGQAECNQMSGTHIESHPPANLSEARGGREHGRGNVNQILEAQVSLPP